MTTQSVLFNREPIWLENRQGLHHRLPLTVQSWTYESGSLTQRLRRQFGPDVAVKVLFNAWRHPFLTERRLLKLPEQHYSVTREVLLHVKGRPLILARTIIPRVTVKTAKSDLSKLGSRPLGEIIFSYPKLERVAMDMSLVEVPTWKSSIVTEVGIQQPVWGRRTVYGIANNTLLVSEFFLPEVLNY